MSAIPAMTTMFYGALPPEVNTGRLMTGAGVEPMYQAAAGWEAVAASLEAQAEELAASLVALQGAWRGASSDRAVDASAPMVAWLRTTALQAQKRALQAVAQASAYTAALAATPPLPEIELNHVTHATLEGTNFLGVNAAPIAANESDYFVRMWNQAADAMAVYQAETTANTVFEPIAPMTPIVVPGVGVSTAATANAQNAAMIPGAMLRETAFGHATAVGQLESAALESGHAGGGVHMALQRAAGRMRDGEDAVGPDQLAQQGTQLVTQVAAQVGSMVGQLPQQMMQPVQQLSQPLQQILQVFGQLGSTFGSDGTQVGLVGASPLSNHPLAGGNGAAAGAGLVRAASLPGLGGTATRTPLLSNLLGHEPPPAPTPGATAGVGGPGLAPVGGGGVGSSGPGGDRGRGAESRPGLKAPSPLPSDDDEEDDW